LPGPPSTRLVALATAEGQQAVQQNCKALHHPTHSAHPLQKDLHRRCTYQTLHLASTVVPGGRRVRARGAAHRQDGPERAVACSGHEPCSVTPRAAPACQRKRGLVATKSNDVGRTAKRAGSQDTNEKSGRGTAAGLRGGARTRTEAKKMTSANAKTSRKEQTKRGGPGRAGARDGTPAAQRSTPERTRAMRGRGQSARAGA
jgi:hypothetical protein